MGLLKILFSVLIICLFSLVGNGQTSDTTQWNVYFFEGDSIVEVIKTDVVILPNDKIHYKKDGKFIENTKDYFLSRERLSKAVVRKYYKPPK
jgi:hypothetical protein